MIVLCINCGHETLMTRRHMEPGPGFPKDRIHYLYKPTKPHFSMYCTNCGHFTVFGAVPHNAET